VKALGAFYIQEDANMRKAAAIIPAPPLPITRTSVCGYPRQIEFSLDTGLKKK
jgi:hypothetical protein